VPGVTEYLRLWIIRSNMRKKTDEAGEDDDDMQLMAQMLIGMPSPSAKITKTFERTGGADGIMPHSRVLTPPSDDGEYKAQVEAAEKKFSASRSDASAGSAVAAAQSSQPKTDENVPPKSVEVNQSSSSRADASQMPMPKPVMKAGAQNFQPAAQNFRPAAQNSQHLPGPQVWHEGSFTNGVIFKANKSTYGECLQRQLFGLPENQMTRSLAKINVGSTALFLFNFETLEMEGVFVATQPPCLNLEPDAWAKSGRSRRASSGSPFPAQVRVRKVMHFFPVHVDAWEHLLNWHTNGSTFDLTLDKDTTRELIKCIRR